MTVTYTGEVANGSSFGCFWKIIVKWRGSVYKLVWRELLAYLVVYYTINLIYRFALNTNQQRTFEKIQKYFGSQSETIPMSFVLGFYVTLVVKRWWEQFRLLPWPDTLAIYVSAGIPGENERQRLMRRNIVRYAVLAYVITLMRVSLRVKRRFPTTQHVVDSGLMLESEKKIFDLMDEKTTMSKYWMPLVWATNIINRARKESLIASDHIVQTMLFELNDIRRRLSSLIGYDTVCVPLVYTQVVTLALYTYFASALLGRQYVLKGSSLEEEDLDMYFPFFTVLQFCFYFGWLKVAEVLINPFGEDDDDIELNWLIDRHIKAAYMIVDEMHEENPEVLKDQYWDEVVPRELPYTVASEHYRREEPKGSAEHYKVKESETMYANLTTVHAGAGITRRKSAAPDDMYADYESVDTPLVERRKNWFARQLTRMGSVRSRASSTAYSSGGLFRGHHNRGQHSPRRNSTVYSTPEVLSGPGAAGQHVGAPTNAVKMSLYDRLVGRKSGRNANGARTVHPGRPSLTKLNLNGSVVLKNRPRIPTPDVTKEVVDRENRLASLAAATHNNNMHHVNGSTISQGVALMAHQLGGNNDLPVVQVVLSPIQELDNGGSVNNTLHAGQPGTAALAQAVLSPALTSAGIGSMIATTPVTVSMPNMSPVQFTPVTMSSMTLTPVSMPQLNSFGISTTAAIPLFTTASPKFSSESRRMNGGSDNGSITASTPTVTLTELASGSEEDGEDSVSANGERSRKTSVTSQNTTTSTGRGSSQKRGEVYV